MPQPRALLASLAFGLAVLSAAAAAAGIVSIHVGVAAPLAGFRVFGAGLLGGAAALVLSLAARGPARAFAVSGGLVALALVLAVPGLRVPAIHDVTTDPEDPPAYALAPRLIGDPDGFTYPAENAPLQRAAYPDLDPIRVAAQVADAYAAAMRAATTLGWDVVRSDPAAGALEATSTSRVFRFVDDVSVRIRPEAGGSRIDLRSRSRVGKSDLGANAARIRAFEEALRAQTR